MSRYNPPREGCSFCRESTAKELSAVIGGSPLVCRDQRGTHRLYLVATGLSWRFWWGCSVRQVRKGLTAWRHGQPVRAKIRPARRSDLKTVMEAGYKL